MKKFLVEGLSGCGKTSVCEELVRRGHKSVDADSELSYRSSKATGAQWLWRKELVEALLARSTGTLFICGCSHNHREFDIFDEVFHLFTDNETLRHRLLTRTNNTYGKDPETLAKILEWNRDNAQNGIALGHTMIDATQSLGAVVTEILGYTQI